MQQTITIKIYKETHDRLKQAHIKNIGRRKKVVSFVQFCDEVIRAGLRKAKNGKKEYPQNN